MGLRCEQVTSFKQNKRQQQNRCFRKKKQKKKQNKKHVFETKQLMASTEKHIQFSWYKGARGVHIFHIALLT